MTPNDPARPAAAGGSPRAAGGLAHPRSAPPRRPIAGAVLWRPDGTVLLQHRDDRPDINSPGRWSLFGGGIEPGEDPEGAMLRELEEEIDFRPERYHPFLTLEGRRAVYHLFLARIEVPLSDLTLREGQGFDYLRAADALERLELTDSAAAALRMLEIYARYRHEQGFDLLID